MSVSDWRDADKVVVNAKYPWTSEEWAGVALDYAKAFVKEREKVQTVQDCLPTLRRLPEMYRHLVMDTPEDQELHRKVTETSDNVLDAVERTLAK
jgi:hypothetical protein